MKAVKGWGGFHLWRGVQGGEPKGGQPSMIDCGDRLQGSDELCLEFSNGKCGREIERKESAGFVTVASLKR